MVPENYWKPEESSHWDQLSKPGVSGTSSQNVNFPHG